MISQLKSALILIFAVLVTGGISIVSPAAQGTPPIQAPQKALETHLANAKLVGSGAVQLYLKDGRHLAIIPKEVLGRLLFWYAEAVRIPATAVTPQGNALGSMVIRIQHRNKRLLVRNLTPTFSRRSGATSPKSNLSRQRSKLKPIARSVAQSGLGPVVMNLDILAGGPKQGFLVDISKAFAGDIPGLSAKPVILASGVRPGGLVPAATYIARARVFPQNLSIRTHLTFSGSKVALTGIPAATTASVVVGHSITLLPEKPMKARNFDERIGYFTTQFAEFEPGKDSVVENRAVVLRHRLQKKNPTAAVSDPIKPIVFYIGREVPNRWRPYIKAGVEDWRQAFEAAGFSNAISAKDAPTLAEDPSWSPEDSRHSVIRWLAQPYANAMGPNLHDPRSGEILSAHILVWPQAIRLFSQKYFALAGAADPKAPSLPLTEELRGRILRYIVSHEVGHTLGLRHNHKASTAYSVSDLRNPDFARQYGSVASIMAYGRFNYVAQPGDGVTDFVPVIGPYDRFAIQWGYGYSDIDDPADLQKQLGDLVARQTFDRRLLWAAGELPQEFSEKLDPTVLTENIGRERIEATRLGAANIQRLLKNLPETTRGSGKSVGLLGEAFQSLLSEHIGRLDSVAKLIGGVIDNKTAPDADRPRFSYPSKTQQRDALHYLLTDGAASLDSFAQPGLLRLFRAVGGVKTVEQAQQNLVTSTLDPEKLALLDMQARLAPDAAYTSEQYLDDMQRIIWQQTRDIGKGAPGWQRVIQRAYVTQLERLLTGKGNGAGIASILIAAGVDPGFATIIGTNAQATVLPSWARQNLPNTISHLKQSEQDAKNARERLHYSDLASRLAALLRHLSS